MVGTRIRTQGEYKILYNEMVQPISVENIHILVTAVVKGVNPVI